MRRPGLSGRTKSPDRCWMMVVPPTPHDRHVARGQRDTVTPSRWRLYGEPASRQVRRTRSDRPRHAPRHDDGQLMMAKASPNHRIERRRVRDVQGHAGTAEIAAPVVARRARRASIPIARGHDTAPPTEQHHIIVRSTGCGRAAIRAATTASRSRYSALMAEDLGYPGSPCLHRATFDGYALPPPRDQRVSRPRAPPSRPRARAHPSDANCLTRVSTAAARDPCRRRPRT